MNGITGGIPDFFKYCIATQRSECSVDAQGNAQFKGVEISPLSRFHFSASFSIGLILLIKKIVMSIFYLICNTVTLGLNQGFKASFSKNIKEGLICAVVVPLGLIGILFPQTINHKVIGIPDDGLTVDFEMYKNKERIH